MAEIPTFQAKQDVARLGRAEYARRLGATVRGGLRLTVGGRTQRLVELDREISFPKGVGDLRTTRLEVVLDAGRVSDRASPLALELTDANFPERIGWRELVVRAERGARVVASSVPAASVSDRLRAYPKDLLQSPLDVTEASARLEPGPAPGVAPALGGPGANGAAGVASRSETGFAALITRDDLGFGVVLLSLVLAMFWGAAHALTPGHGKAIVAAYLVGTKGRPRDALALGGIVTMTHTIGVFALGLVTLLLSEFIVPETLYPWLNVVSALLVVAVGATVLRQRILLALRGGSFAKHHHHGGHHHDHHQHHGHDHDHGGHDHEHGHSHVPEPGSGARGLLAVGISGGYFPAQPRWSCCWRRSRSTGSPSAWS